MSSNSTGLPPGYALGSYWYYAPNKGAPIAFATFFLISGLIHVWQCFRYKCWKVGGLLPWAATLFTAGFIMREIGAHHFTNLKIYISSTVLLLVAPPVYEGANYFLLGRILYYVPYHSPIHPGRVVTTFVAIDGVIGAFTGNGGARVANPNISDSARRVGTGLLKAALLLQLASMGIFVAIAVRYHRNCIKGGQINKNLRSVLLVLYTSCTLITIRTIYRVVEYFAAVSLNPTNIFHISPVLRHEWFFWVFEATVMLFNSVLINVFHPSRFLPPNNKIFLAEDGITEIEGPGFDDKRPFLLTLFDPFDVVGLIQGRDKKNRYWEQPQGGAQNVSNSESNSQPKKSPFLIVNLVRKFQHRNRSTNSTNTVEMDRRPINTEKPAIV